MAQNGLHGLVGMAVAAPMLRRAPIPVRDALAVGIVIGAMLPDIDMYPTAAVFLAGRADLIYTVHRSLTHSLFFVLMLAVAGRLLRGRNRAAAAACGGLSLGVATHAALDTFVWYAPIDLFWPLSRSFGGVVPLLPIINLWAHVRPPVLLGNPATLQNVLQAFELGFFALYLDVLRGIARRAGVSDDRARRLRIASTWLWALCAVVAIAAPFVSEKQALVMVTVPYLLPALPFCWYHTVQLRAAIASQIGGAAAGQA